MVSGMAGLGGPTLGIPTETGRRSSFQPPMTSNTYHSPLGLAKQPSMDLPDIHSAGIPHEV